ncbi:purine-cytosine permease family protein [Aminobacterium mobile]
MDKTDQAVIQSLEIEDQFYDYPDRPVPANKKRSRLNIAMVTTGMAVAMSTLYTGASLASILTYKDACLSIIVGCTILCIVASLTGNIAAKKGVPFAMLSRYAFGRKGSNIVGLVFATSMLGWFSYQCGYFGETINILSPNNALTSIKVATLWGGLLMMSTAIIGFKGMTFLSMLASPLLLIMCLYSGYRSVVAVGMQEIINNIPANPASLGVGITIVIGGWITGAILQPDISRYAKNSKDNVLGTIIAMIVFAAANWGGVLVAKATSTPTIMQGLVKLGLGAIALWIVILGQWTSNDNNLYSAALGVINVKPGLNKHVITAIMGIIFTVIAVLGIQNYFIRFLEILGTFLPPFGAVVVCDYYLFKKDSLYVYENATEKTYEPYRWTAIFTKDIKRMA